MSNFFKNCWELDRMVLKPLSHIYLNWELTWDNVDGKYLEEEDSFVDSLNKLIEEIKNTIPPERYHDNEDVLVEYVKENFGLSMMKQGSKWVWIDENKGSVDYIYLLEQGGWNDIDENNLVKAAAGRIKAAERFNQNNFDDMEKGHKKILAYVLSIILYHRYNYSD